MLEDKISAAIVEGTAKERRDAIDFLYQKCYPSIKRLVLSKGSEQQAEDIFQDGMGIMYKNVLNGKFKQDAKLSTYLISICKNLWLMDLRSKKIEEIDVMIVDLPEEPELSLEEENLVKLQEELNPDCQKILRLFYYDDKSMEEIRVQFDLSSEQAAKTKKYRCLKRLMEIVEEKGLSYESFIK